MTQLKGEYKVEAILHEIAVKINFDLGFLRVLAQFLISFFLQLYLTWKNPWPQKNH